MSAHTLSLSTLCIVHAISFTERRADTSPSHDSPPGSSHLTVNNLSHHVLLSHLLPVLEKTSKLPNTDVRIIQMSSELHRATLGGPSETFGGGK